MIFEIKHNSNYDNLSDRKLVSAVLKGNQDAIVYFFYSRYSATFQYHIYNLFQYKVDVAELVDEFFLFLYADNWKRLRTYDPSKASLNTWISTVSFRFFRDYKRSKIDLNGLITTNDRWDDAKINWTHSVDEAFIIDFKVAVSSVRNERDRHIAERIFLEDADYEKIASEFGLTVDYVYTVKNRLLKQLKNKMKGYEY